MNCPDYLRQHKLAWFYTPIWRSVHEENDMWSAVYCAKPRKGKSWLTLRHAWDLDRGENGKPRFPIDCSRVYFTAGDFAKGLAGDWPAGTVHVLDDAGLNLFSREGMSRTVMDVAKIFQSIRYKNYIILMSLPSLNMLDKAVRTLIHCYIQPNKMDTARKMVRAGIRNFTYNPSEGDLYRKKFVRSKIGGNTWLDYNIKDTFDVNEIWFDAPPKELTDSYEEKKARCLGKYYDSVANKIIEREEIKKSFVKDDLYLSAYNAILSNPGGFCFEHPTKGLMVDVVKLISYYPDLPQYKVVSLSRQANNKLKSIAFTKQKEKTKAG